MDSVEKKALDDSLKKFYESKNNKNQTVVPTDVANNNKFNPEDFKNKIEKETDPDLIIGCEEIELPSKGIFYENKISKIMIEYLTAKDEDLLTTPSLLENGSVLDILLKRKVKTNGVDIENMLTGDKNAILLFLRASSYGNIYKVNVYNPYIDKSIPYDIDLNKIKYKTVNELPNENLEFSIRIPKRDKLIKFRLLNDVENKKILQKANILKEEYNSPFAEISTMKLKAAVMEIDGNRNKDYIIKFIDAIPAGDALVIRKKMREVEPDIDLNYEFITPQGNFFATIKIGLDFFFPSL